MKKTCVVCKELKQLSDFHKKSAAKDGLQPVCKPCALAAGRRYARSAKGKATSLAYRKTEKATRARRKYRNTPAAKAAHMERLSRYQTNNPHKLKAKTKVSNAIRSGKLVAAKNRACEMESLGCSGVHHYHHDSYREEDWLNVRVLCRAHHVLWHQNNTPTPFNQEPDVASFT